MYALNFFSMSRCLSEAWQWHAYVAYHPLGHDNAALAMPKFVHRESVGRLKKPRGTVAYRCFRTITLHGTLVYLMRQAAHITTGGARVMRTSERLRPWGTAKKYINQETKDCFQFEIIINVSVTCSSSLFIWIPMLRVYVYYKYVNTSLLRCGDRL